MLFTRVFVISALTFFAAAQEDTTEATPLPTDISGAQVTEAAEALVKYLSTKTTDPAYIAAEAAFTSAVPSSIMNQITMNPEALLEDLATQTETPDWYTAVPTSAQNVLSSVGAEELAIISSELAGPAPTNAAKIAGAALAAGAAALAML